MDDNGSASPAAIKARMRQEAFARRDGLAREWRDGASERICDQVLDLVDLTHLEPIGGYWPMRSEVDCRAILEGLAARGQIVALSQIRPAALAWRSWQPGDALVPGGFGVEEPGSDATDVFPRALLVPLAAFDRHGNRLGYGKGHFDRSIAALSERGPLLTIGLAYSIQEVDAVPAEPHDRPLDMIVTETGILRPDDRDDESAG